MTLPGVGLASYVANGFAVLHEVSTMVASYPTLGTFDLCMVALIKHQIEFITCEKHAETVSKMINRKISNIFLKNSSIHLSNDTRIQSVNRFKERQRKKQRIE